ncbi:hypothetical protein ACSBR8_03050 [Pseudomonas aeruginosa]|uniref:hypothetical protein n=1 Tax=Pseudomonas aeruginosa TaxID=287 RepID=UPI003EC077D2
MSEVKKISPVGNIYGWEESQFGEFVLSQDYDDLAEEAQALREEVAAAQKSLAFTEQWFAVRHERLWHWAHEELSEEQKRRYFNIVANGTAEHNEPPTYAQQLCRMKHRAESAEQELAALRARVVVLPDASTVYAALDARERLFTSPENIRVALEAQSRLNGKTVSASALDTLRRFATGEVGHLNNGHCPDDLEGRSARDPNCSVCRALIETDKENGNG